MKMCIGAFLKKYPKFPNIVHIVTTSAAVFFKERCFQKSHKLFEKEFVAQSGHTDDNNVKE